MKRIIIAISIVLVIGGLTVAGNITMNNIIAEFESQLDEIIMLSQKQDQALATEKIHDFAHNFKEKRHWLELFVKRDYVLTLNVSIEGMRAYPTNDTWNDLECEAEKAYEQLSSIRHLFFSIV